MDGVVSDARVEPRIEGARVALTPFDESHLADPAYRRWLRDPAVVAPLNLPRYLAGEVSDAEIEAYARRLMADDAVWFFALLLRDEREFVGTVKAGPIDRYAGRADLGVMIGRTNLWGRGLASDALGALARRLIEGEGLRRLTAGAMATNPSMIRVFEKLGFQREGVFRQHDRQGDVYIDHIHLGCLADELRTPNGADA